MTFNRHFTRFGNEPLTEDRLRQLAPAIFAEQAHESRSDRYTYIPTDVMLRGMDNAGFKPYSVQQGKSRIEGKAAFTKHLIRFRHEDAAKGIEVGKQFYEVVLKNSHDGTSQYEMFGGIFKCLCLNGMVVGTGYGQRVKVPHRGDPERVMSQIIEGAYTVIEDSKEIMDRVDRWSQIQLTDNETLALANSVVQIRFPDANPEVKDQVVRQFVRARRPQERAARDLWTASNVMQEHAIRGGVRYWRAPFRDSTGKIHPSRNVTTKEIRSVDGTNAINEAIWALTETMARLKEAA